ncbi:MULTISPECIES: helix-turn-helix domain-containing protein [unclassified Paenibacillus]|uniref:helix-turn-helix domain-containing protein n=1 Tax=unclassified Paenibacillus TaxID=185978 RepID=UPI00210CB659|nr:MULTISPECIES: helix-turn-helix domain-containing protein [unclassified Paenibacillus]
MKKTLFNRLLFSYMPIFIIVVTFTFFVFFQLLSEQSRKEALNANKMLSLQAMRLIDTSLKAIDNMVMKEMINNEQLNDFFSTENNDNIYINISAVKKMQDMISSYPLIDSIYLVRYADDFVLSNATSDQLQNYKDEPFIKRSMNPLASKQWSGVRSFEQFSVKGSKPVVSLVRGAPFITGEKGMIVVNVATDSLRSSIADLYDSKSSFIGIRDAAGSALFSGMSSAEQRVSSNYVSSYTGWSYQSGLVNGKVFLVMSSLYNVWFIIGIAMIVLGFVWLIYVTRRNSKPLEQIVARIRGYRLPLSKEGGDEFSFIESALSNIIEQSNQFQQKHEEDRHLRIRYLFHQLIEGDSDFTHEEWLEETSSLQLPFASGSQAALVIEMDKYNDFCNHYSRNDQNLLKFALRSVIQELASKHGLTLWEEWTSAYRLSVIMFGEPEEGEAGTSAIVELFEHVRLWVQDNLKFTITVGIGEQVSRLSDVAGSHQEALRALKHKIVLGENRLITSEHLANHDQAEVFSHLNAIRAITQSFRLIEDEWKTKYDELFSLMKQGLLTKDEITNLMNYFTYFLGREMAGMTKEYQELWMRDGLPQLSKIIEQCHSLEQMREETLDVLNALYACLQEAQDRRLHAATIRDMRKFIEEEYANPNMSLDYLSTTFNISSKYVSKLFKEETGQKFVDFLIDLRMLVAQRLLVETQASVQEVAEQVGYTSAISFSRVFKKVTGSSPSEFREGAARRQSG